MAQRLDSLEEKFLKTIKENNLIEKGDKIVVGVSGGPDSITLLACLNKYKAKLGCNLVCAHINHLIRKDSTEDEQYVENVCKKMDIPFYAKRVEVLKIAETQKIGTEEAGRKIRYDFFNEILKKEKANKIAIAHNKNDNAETMLLNLIRGTGMSGLEGIQPQEYGKYIRPLINIDREEIENYCDKYDLKPRIDSTNKENIYTRNIVRNEIITKLKEINPNIIEALSRTSKIIKLDNDFIKEYSRKEYEDLALEEQKCDEKILNNEINIKENKILTLETAASLRKISLDIKRFNEEPEAVKQYLIIMAVEKLAGNARNVEKTNIDDIVKLASRNIGNKFLQINKKIIVYLKNNRIFFIGDKHELP